MVKPDDFWSKSSDGQYVTAQEQACNYIRHQVLNGNFPGGAKVQVNEIANALDISRMPVREAIRQLDTEGLLNIRPNRGAVVAALTAEEVKELFEMRAALEGLAARKAQPFFDEDAVLELDLLKQRLDRARGNAEKWISHHNDFHDFICRLAGRPRLEKDIQRLRTALHPYLLMYIKVYGHAEMEDHEHSVIFEAIATGDPGIFEDCITAHIMSAAQGIMDFVNEDPKLREGESASENDKKVASN